MSKNKRPISVDSSIVASLSSVVPLGEYRVFHDLSHLPSGIPSGGNDCQGVILAASTFDSSSVPGLSPPLIPNRNVYLIKYIRAYPNGVVSKMDNCLYYLGENNTAWRLHSKDSPDHHEAIISGSGMSEICHDRKIPSASSGTLQEYRYHGADLDFERFFD